MSGRASAIRSRFDAAAGYDRAAALQRGVAGRLAARIGAEALPPRPAVLELGCGTGLLSAALAAHVQPSLHVLTDLAPAMVARTAARLGPAPGRHYLAMDAERPALRPGFDLICASLAAQWFAQRPETFGRLAALLAPGGLLALSTLAAGTFREWSAAHLAEGWRDPVDDYPAPATLDRDWPTGGRGRWEIETEVVPHASALDFLRGLKRLGAGLPRDGVAPLSSGALRRVMRRFAAESDARATYEVAYGLFRADGSHLAP